MRAGRAGRARVLRCCTTPPRTVLRSCATNRATHRRLRAHGQDSPQYELALQLVLRRLAERGWRSKPFMGGFQYKGVYYQTPTFGCFAGWGGSIGASPGRAKLALKVTSDYHRSCHFDRENLCELILGHNAEMQFSRRHCGDACSLESGISTGAGEEAAAYRLALCGTLLHLRALAEPIPFHASTKAALGPRLLDTLRGLRGADVELPPGFADEVWDDLAPWSCDVAAYNDYVNDVLADEEEEDEDEYDEDEPEVVSTRSRSK